MPPFDSDSSGGEEEDYTETNVLLGYASKEETDDTISHIGGRPTWLDPTTAPSSALAKCKICNSIMVLLLQLNGDLPEQFPGHERRLYILSCRSKTCRRKEGSVRVLRGLRVSQIASGKKPEKKKEERVEQKKKPTVGLGESLFGAKPSTGSSGNANPFSTGSSGNSNPFSTSNYTPAKSNPFATSGLNVSELAAKPPQNPPPPATGTSKEATEAPPKTFASALSLNNNQAQKFGLPPPSEPWPTKDKLPTPYLLYHLDADYETLEKEPEVEIPVQTMDLDEPSSSGGAKEDKDVYESTIDKTFQKFADRSAQNPEQVLRYEFKGTPLLYAKNDDVGKLFGGARDEGKVKVQSSSTSRIPRCANCGAGRVFEVQLMPHAILELEREEVGLDGMEWGTLVVGVCERDCLESGKSGREVGYLEEWVGVQWEEVAKR